MAPGDLFRYAVLTLVGLVVAGLGLKWWGKQSAEKRIVIELRSHVNPTASFEQFYAADAENALYRAMEQLYLGEQRLKSSPHALLDLVFETKGTGNLFGTSDPTNSYELDPREAIIRSALLRNYENCKRLGVFTDSVSRDALSRGEAPQIQEGPAEGEWARVRYIIDPAVSPGAEKIVPNLVIGPPPEPGGSRPNEFDIAQAKTLAHSLQRAGLLENKARDRIVDYYDEIGKEPEPAPDDKELSLEEALKQ